MILSSDPQNTHVFQGVFFSSTRHHPPDKVAFLNGEGCREFQSRKERIEPKVHMSRLKGDSLCLLDASYIHDKGREYGDGAATISPTHENPFPDVALKVYFVFGE